MAVAIIEIIFAIIEGNPNPSGACSIYANAIKVHIIAGINDIMYFSSFLIKFIINCKYEIIRYSLII